MTKTNPGLRSPRRRWLYALAGSAVIALGLLSRSEFLSLPPFLAKYGADALWALLIFLGFGFLLPSQPTPWVAGLAILFCCGIECSQLYHAPWIDSLRRTRLGALILGDTFAWADITAYLVGTAVGMTAELVFRAIQARARQPVVAPSLPPC
jgi:hypothetical protein